MVYKKKSEVKGKINSRKASAQRQENYENESYGHHHQSFDQGWNRSEIGRREEIRKVNP